ncbi:MAG: type II toxin-antitoxin system PemK/MazF family toxin [Actinomycetota bacterium]|nr:type II toxin-antitoxin system PemK/MazF family toxin [Actinomycetota bacterium]
MSGPWPLVRGRIYAAVIPPLEAEKYFLVVSNNQRNAALPQALAVRLTTSSKPQLASIIELSSQEPFTGRALCDDIVELYEDEVRRDLGAVSPQTMLSIGLGLRAALGIRN